MDFQLDHVAISVKNLDESVRWYENMLGFRLVNTYQTQSMKIAILKSGNFRLELFDFGGKTKPLPKIHQNVMADLLIVGTKHFSLKTSEFDKTMSDFKKKGIVFASEIDIAGLGERYIFFKDCNGILIELSEDTNKT